jgi:hypothetical protein
MEAEPRVALGLVAKSAESLALANFVRPQADVADILGDILRSVDVLASAKTPFVFLCGHAAFATPLVVTLPHLLFNRARVWHFPTRRRTGPAPRVTCASLELRKTLAIVPERLL